MVIRQQTHLKTLSRNRKIYKYKNFAFIVNIEGGYTIGKSKTNQEKSDEINQGFNFSITPRIGYILNNKIMPYIGFGYELSQIKFKDNYYATNGVVILAGLKTWINDHNAFYIETRFIKYLNKKLKNEVTLKSHAFGAYIGYTYYFPLS